VEIFNLMQRHDGDIARFFDDPKRSRALAMLAHMRSDGVIRKRNFPAWVSRHATPSICWSAPGDLLMAVRSRFSTRTVVDSKYLVPWLAAEGPLAYSPAEPPAKDYFFQYTWILPEIFEQNVNLREHRGPIGPISGGSITPKSLRSYPPCKAKFLNWKRRLPSSDKAYL
jgi:hypothetical protein